MDQYQNAWGMLDLIQEPAFCVQNGIIIKVNAAASGLLIEPGIRIQSLLRTGKEEYAAFSGGCLYLSVCIAGHSLGASVSRMPEFDVFCLEQDETNAHLQSMALAARELREPLSTVMTLADKLLPTAIGEDSKSQAQMSQLNRGLFRMLRIISNMSDAERYVADTGARLEVCNLCAALQEIFQRSAALTEHTGIKLQYTGYPESVYTLADVQKLERMVFNILSNAIRFSPDGGTITAALTRRGTRMYLSVCDSGSGIPENLRGSIFSRYARQSAIEDGRYGLGLGMVLIRSTAAIHGGTVLVDHPEGCGTRITVSFAIRSGDATICSPKLRIDYAGERDHGLIELSDVLPAYLYDPDSIN